MVEAIQSQLDHERAEKIMTAYTAAKAYLCDNIYPAIARTEPDLTSHDESHVTTVLDRIADLVLPLPEAAPTLSALDLYVLAMAALFHDVGNIDGRIGHPTARSLPDIFTAARGDAAEARRERTVVLAAIRAHGGEASDGSADTLREVKECDPLYNQTVKLRWVSAILRFADELAEGPERTSEFCRKNHRYAHDSQVYHDYSSITHIAVDTPNHRVLLQYEIDISDGCPDGCTGPSGDCPCTDTWSDWCAKLIGFVYDRAVTLDQERRYAKYYCPLLSGLVSTEVSLTFHWRGQQLLLDELTPNPICLDEKVVPGNTHVAGIADDFPSYDVAALIDAIRMSIGRLRR